MGNKIFYNRIAKTTLLLAIGLLATGLSTHAQSLSGFFNRVRSQIPKTEGKNGGVGVPGLSNSEIGSGLKQALEIGTKTATQQLSQKDGFFKNAVVKVLIPPEAQQVASSLRSIGMGSVVDDAVLAMNRAAEDAASKAAPIFLNAIKGMTIQDGIQILRGGNNAATLYLEQKTTPALTAAFSPVIAQSLDKTGATKMWKTVFDTYNHIPFVSKKVNPDLTGYVTQQALKGVFIEIANEELKIRTDPAAQVTSLLQKVFGKQN